MKLQFKSLVFAMSLLGLTSVSAQEARNIRQTTEYAHRIKIPMSDALQGCIKNDGLTSCDQMVALIVTGFIPRTETLPELSSLDQVLPNALWNSTQNRFRYLYTKQCDAVDLRQFQNWMDRLPIREDTLILAELLEPLGGCFGQEKPDTPPKRRYFWLFDGQTVIGSIECSTPETVPNPHCSVLAFPNHGQFYLQLGYFPLINMSNMIKQYALLVAKLKNSIPKDIPVDWSFMPEGKNVIIPNYTQDSINELVEAQSDKLDSK